MNLSAELPGETLVASLAGTKSSPVRSAQEGPHPNLLRRVERHLGHPWRQPIPAHSRTAFAAVTELLADEPERPFVLDCGCGTGSGTPLLAERHVDCTVIGIDQSVHRLSRGGSEALPRREGHCLWVRAELSAFWRLALEAGWPVRKAYLLYPNPWPKPAHLARRWHGHPVFPALLELAETIELRTNWRIYAEEFALAAARVLGREQQFERLEAAEPLSAFERKYQASGHALYRVSVETKKSPGEPGL